LPSGDYDDKRVSIDHYQMFIGGGRVEAASGAYGESDNLFRVGQHPPEVPHPFVMG